MNEPRVEPLTDVIFRAWRGTGEVIALFPYESYGTNRGEWWLCQSFEHIGQHSAASIELIGTTREARPDEYADLMRELQGRGYRLRVIKRVNRNKMRETAESQWQAGRGQA